MKYLKLTVLAILLQQANLFSQQINLKETRVDDRGKIMFAVPANSLSTNPENERLLLQTIVSSEKRLTFHLARTISDNKYQHKYYTFSFLNLEIVGADYVVHTANTKILFANGNLPDLNDSGYLTNPRITLDQAQSLLYDHLSEVNKKAGSEKNLIKEVSNKGLVWFYRQYQLLLAYKVEVKSANPLESGIYFIDAASGNQLGFYPDVCSGHNEKSKPPNAAGNAQTLYSGVQNFITDDNFNGGFRLRQVRNGVNILTLNAGNQIDPETIVNTATDFFDNDNNWQAAEHGVDRYATDVHWATQNVIDYWQQIHNRNSIDGNGAAARGYVHTFMPQFNNVNAFWARIEHAMFYADGNAGIGPIAAFDVVAHEFGHGVCQFTSDLIPGTAESGALNEGFSDIWGAAIEAFAAPNKQRWLIGEDIFAGSLRNIENPNDPFTFEGSHPDTFLGDFWDPGGEPHNNSTVLSHWFFLLSEGGTGTNDLGNNFIVAAIGMNDASRIVYLTEQLLNSNANYAMARTMSVQAAITLFGGNSCQVRAVENAWFAVGVGNASNVQPVFTSNITGPSSICGTVDFFIDAFPTGSTITWLSSNNTIMNIIGSGVSNVTVFGSGTGTATLTATITPPQLSCYAQYNVTKQVSIQPQFTGNEEIIDNNTPGNAYCINSFFNASVTAVPTATNYQWTTSNNLQISFGNGTSSVLVNATGGGWATLTATIVTPCGNRVVSHDYYIGSVFASKVDPPFDLVSIDCHTGAAVIQADTYGAPTIYYWTITEYSDKNVLLSTSNFTTTSNILNLTANPQTTHGTICLSIDVNGCGISIPFCYNFSLPCPGGHRINKSANQLEQQLLKGSELTLYPNPVKDLIVLQLAEIPISSVSLEIFDAAGRLIKKQIYTAGKNILRVPVDFSDGVYFVRVRYDNKSFTKKFIKQ